MSTVTTDLTLPPRVIAGADHQRVVPRQPLIRSLTSAPAVPRQHLAALAIGLLLILIPLLSLPVILHQGPFIQVFLPMWGSVACVADLLTAYLLFGQFSGTRTPAQAALATTYLYSGTIIVPYMLTFPHIFASTGLLHAAPQTAVWLWICWHGGVPLGLLSYALLDMRWGRVVLTEHGARRLLSALVLFVPLTVALLTIAATYGSRLLPVLVQGTHFTPLFSAGSPVGICLLGVSLAALMLLATRLQHASLVDLWLSVVALACFLDIAINLLVRSRYTIGWYESRLNTVVASMLVLGVLLYEVSRLYTRLAQSEAGLRNLVERAPVGMCITDESGVIALANAAYCDFFGYQPEELLGRLIGVVLSPNQQVPAVTADLGAAREWHVITKAGEARTVLGAGVSIRGADGVLQQISCIQDITERKEAEARLAELAHYDRLTGLPNRTLFLARLDEGLAQAMRDEGTLALLFLDLDGFKAVNDTHGHGTGDLLLQVVAERLAGCVREGDTVARLAGDEFTILLPGLAHATNATTVAEKIVAALATPFTLADRVVSVSASVGIALYPTDADGPSRLMAHADAAMYAVKQAATDRLARLGSSTTTALMGGGS